MFKPSSNVNMRCQVALIRARIFLYPCDGTVSTVEVAQRPLIILIMSLRILKKKLSYVRGRLSRPHAHQVKLLPKHNHSLGCE